MRYCHRFGIIIYMYYDSPTTTEHPTYSVELYRVPEHYDSKITK